MAASEKTASIGRLAVLGVGLMGGSLALAARHSAEVEEVRGYDIDSAAIQNALDAGVITHGCASAAEAVSGADLVAVCTPVRSIVPLVDECMRADPLPRLITDMGSTKYSVIDSLSPAARSRFVGGHPMCGAETSGVRFARETLFERATYFLCPSSGVSPEDYEVLHAFIAQIGARPVAIDAQTHDRIMALVSHVPHVIANVIMTEVGSFESGGRRALFSVGPSFKDLTRVAGSNPQMWRDIFVENREALAASLWSVAAGIAEFCNHLVKADEKGILDSISSAAAYRRELLQCQDIAPETLHRLTVRIPDEPGVLSRVMTALGNANINIEDLTLHHFNRRVGGDLIMFVSGEEAAGTAYELVTQLGYAAALSFAGDLHG